jgi:hypothetical protein
MIFEKPMHLRTRMVLASLGAGIAIAAWTFPAVAENLLPDAPAPQSLPSQNAQPTTPNPLAPAPDGSSSQRTQPDPPAPSLETELPSTTSRYDTAAQQIRVEEKQRVLGIIPNFNTSYVSNAATLSAGQKMQLAFRSASDPVVFASAFLVAGFDRDVEGDTAFGSDSTAFFQRAGAAYLDSFNGTMIGNGILPVLLHQDPRYFRLGRGSADHRILYAIGAAFICKHDYTGRWEPNYSNVGGNIIAGAISNLYYPNGDSGWGQTVTNGMVVTAEGTAGSLFQEFWPDISRRLFRKDPTHGLDAEAAADRARSTTSVRSGIS